MSYYENYKNEINIPTKTLDRSPPYLSVIKGVIMLSLQREMNGGCQPYLDEKEPSKLPLAILTLEKASSISAFMALSRQ